MLQYKYKYKIVDKLHVWPGNNTWCWAFNFTKDYSFNCKSGQYKIVTRSKLKKIVEFFFIIQRRAPKGKLFRFR